MTTSFSLVVTGATGFVGQGLLRSVATEMPNLPIISLVRSLDNCKQINELPINLIKRHGSLHQLPSDFLPQTPHVLVHLAVKQIDRDDRGFKEDNVDGTKNLLSQVNKHTLGVIYNSSMSVYGTGSQKDIKESMAINPQTPLAKSRAASEMLIKEQMACDNRWAFLLRPRFVLGNGDRFVLPGLLKLSLKRVRINKGKQRFSIIDVDDYGKILLRLSIYIAQQAQYPQQQELNIGYREPVSFAELINALKERYFIPTPMLRIPVSSEIIDIYHKFPIQKLQNLNTKLLLIGLDHYGNTTKLASLVGKDLIHRSPEIVLKQVVSSLTIQ